MNIDRHRGGERAVLVHIDFFRRTREDALVEFKELAIADALDVLAVITTKRDKPDAKFFIGSGKAQEICELAQSEKADVVLFNNELTPAQGRNLEALFQCRVLDRTELILDIFAKRARSFEGKLQVELAQLKHLRTCLVRGWTHLERQKGGIGLRGPGEKQLETDRRLLDLRIKGITKRLTKVSSQRAQSRRARKKASIPSISLVGYTNAGKSTLFNLLTEANVYAAEQLFATLDPTLRQIHIAKIGKVILADTVGFIRDLPTELVAAFRATLEETREADLLLHVVDAARADSQQLVQDVNAVLTEIGAENVRQLKVYNKIDLEKTYQPRIDRDAHGKPKRVWISAKTKVGMPLLEEAIIDALAQQLIRCELILSGDSGKLRAKLYELGAVKKEWVDGAGQIVIEIELQRKDYRRLIAQ